VANPAQSAAEEGAPVLTFTEPADEGDDAVTDRFWIAVRRLPRYARLAIQLGRDERVPKRTKALLVLGGAYTISPVDLIPGIIPIAGQVDDVLVLLLTLRQTVRACPPEVAAEHLERSGLTLANFDEDLAAARDTARWLAEKGWRAGNRIAREGSQRLRSAIRRWQGA
jgi:uncharacterized membrane protein YkvA (DUF1232 family)